MRQLALVLGVPIIAVASVYATQSAPSTSIGASRATLDRYCISCHNQKRPTADLALDTLDLTNVTANARTLEKVAARLRSRTMPPAGMPRPDRPTYDAVAEGIEASLDAYSAAHPDPGRPVIHRLNRAEYTNAVRDLLALEVDVRALLPADDAGYGFDNISDVLSLSPALLERYMTAAGKISQLAVGSGVIRPVVQTYSVPQTLLQRDRMSEALPFGTRGGASVRHYFPANGEYRDPDPAAANPRQPDSRAGRAERDRAAPRPAARGSVQCRRRGTARSVVGGAERLAVRVDCRRQTDRALDGRGGGARSQRRIPRQERASRRRPRARAGGRHVRIRRRPRRGDGRRHD